MKAGCACTTADAECLSRAEKEGCLQLCLYHDTVYVTSMQLCSKAVPLTISVSLESAGWQSSPFILIFHWYKWHWQVPDRRVGVKGSQPTSVIATWETFPQNVLLICLFIIIFIIIFSLWPTVPLCWNKSVNPFHYFKRGVASRLREVIVHLCSALVRSHWSTASKSGVPSKRRMWNC